MSNEIISKASTYLHCSKGCDCACHKSGSECEKCNISYYALIGLRRRAESLQARVKELEKEVDDANLIAEAMTNYMPDAKREAEKDKRIAELEAENEKLKEVKDASVASSDLMDGGTHNV